MDFILHFSLIFIAIHSIIFLSQPDLDQINSNFLYSPVHSIVNLNKNRGEAEHKKHGNILKTHLIVFPCFLWMFIRGPWILLGKRPETIYKMHTEIRNSFSSLGAVSNIYLRNYSLFLKYPRATITFFFEYVPVFPCTVVFMLLNVLMWTECVWTWESLDDPWRRLSSTSIVMSTVYIVAL